MWPETFDLSIEFLIIWWPVLQWKTLFTILGNELLFIRNQVLFKKWKLLGVPAQIGVIIVHSNFTQKFYRIFPLQNKYEQITKISALKSKPVLTFKHTYLQTYYSWINHCAYFHLHLLGSRATVVDPVYSRLFQDFCNMCTRNQYLCLHFWHLVHLMQLFIWGILWFHL